MFMLDLSSSSQESPSFDFSDMKASIDARTQMSRSYVQQTVSPERISLGSALLPLPFRLHP